MKQKEKNRSLQGFRHAISLLKKVRWRDRKQKEMKYFIFIQESKQRPSHH